MGSDFCFCFCRVETCIPLDHGPYTVLSPPFVGISNDHVDARNSLHADHPTWSCVSFRRQVPLGVFFDYLRHPISAHIQGRLPIQTIDYPSANSGSHVRANYDSSHPCKAARRTCWKRRQRMGLWGARGPSLVLRSNICGERRSFGEVWYYEAAE